MRCIFCRKLRRERFLYIFTLAVINIFIVAALYTQGWTNSLDNISTTSSPELLNLQERDLVNEDKPKQLHANNSQHCLSFANADVDNDVPLSSGFHKLAGLYVYSAFWDHRENDFDNNNADIILRIVGIKPQAFIQRIHCWFPVSSKVEHKTTGQFYLLGEDHGTTWQGFILSCKVPKAVHARPCSVRLTALSQAGKKIDETKLSIQSMLPWNNGKRAFHVCVPPLFGSISPSKLVEFIELSMLLGAENFTFYDFDVNVAVRSVLRYYATTGVVQLLDWHLPISEKFVWYKGQIPAIQDCLYRSVSKAELVVFSDLDEFIIPNSVMSWIELFDSFNKKKKHKKASGYKFQSAHFATGGAGCDYTVSKRSETLVSLDANCRTRGFSERLTKCIIRPEDVFEMGIHHISKPLFQRQYSLPVTPNTSIIHHYRHTCSDSYHEMCDDYVVDDTMKRYEKLLESRVKNTLHDLYTRGVWYGQV